MKEVLEENAPAASPAAEKTFTTISARPIEPLYRPDDVADVDYDRDTPDPGRGQSRISRVYRSCDPPRSR